MHEIDLDYVLREADEAYQQTADLKSWAEEHQEEYEELKHVVDSLVNHLVDVIVPWDSSAEYPIYSIVEYQGTNYIAVQDVPVGTMITNTEYWQPANTVIQQINAIGAVTSGLQEDMQDLQEKVESDRFWYYPEDFGAVGDGETDDTAAFQTMFNTVPGGSTIMLKARQYKVSNGLTLDKGFIKIVGQMGRDEYGPALLTDGAAGSLLTVTRPGLSIYNVVFDAVTKVTGQTFVTFDLDDADEGRNGNIDALIDNCCMIRADVAMVAKGRNVRVYDGLYSWCTIVLRITQTAIDTDIRGFEFTNNRVHYCSLMVQNQATNLRTPKNIFISGNFADATATLFAGVGGGVVISGNYIDQEGITLANLITIESDPSGLYDYIVGNTCKSTGAGGGLGIIYSKVSMEGNTFNNFYRGFALYDESIVLGNAFIECADNAGGSYPIAFGAATTGVCTGNAVKGTKVLTKAAGSQVNVVNNYNF